jgi:tetratricopeptide (TPR) repeat protein
MGAVMKAKRFATSAFIVALTMILVYGCGSTEMTSAKLYLQQKNYEKAMEMLQKDVSKNGGSAENYYLQGTVYAEDESFEKMNEVFDSSLAYGDKFAQDILAYRYNAWSQNYNKGVKYYQAAADASDEDSVKTFYQKSEVAFEDAISAFPDSSAKVYSNLIYVRNEQARKIWIDFKADGAVEDSVEAMKIYNESAEIMEGARKMFPESKDILQGLIDAYLQASRFEDAEREVKKGVEEDPENKFFRLVYGIFLTDAKEWEGARAQLKKAVEIDPDFTEAKLRLVDMYIKWGKEIKDETEAIEDISEEKAEERRQMEIDKYEESLPYIESYLADDPNNAPMWERLGQVYTITGDEEKALEAFDNADTIRAGGTIEGDDVNVETELD